MDTKNYSEEIFEKLRALNEEVFTADKEGIEDLDDNEERQSDDEEGNDCIDEASPIDDGRKIIGPSCAVKCVESLQGILPLNECIRGFGDGDTLTGCIIDSGLL